MKRRDLLVALVTPTIAGGCVQPVAPVLRPPPGGPTADAMYPPIGARWKLRTTERELLRETVVDRDFTAVPADLNGVRGYGLASPGRVRVLNAATFNTIGSTENGRVATVASPEVGPFSWPLWVGKSWDTTYTFTDFIYGQHWPVARSHATITAFENVTVPAGTFSAFRIEQETGIGSESSGGFRTQGVPGIGAWETWWYAPGPKIIVKNMIVRRGSNYRGGARITSDLLTVPV